MNRKSNPNWPSNYINAIKKALNNYDIILVWDRPDILEEYQNNNFDYWLVYPDEHSLEIYKERYLNRGNSPEYVDKKMKQYREYSKIFEQKSVKKVILSRNETLEDYLLKKENIKLIEKDM